MGSRLVAAAADHSTGATSAPAGTLSEGTSIHTAPR